MKANIAGIALLVALLGSPARAEVLPKAVGPVLRAKMPEPLLTESITDLDGTHAGEVEIDLNGAASRRTSAPRQWQSSVEIEWRALERLGLALDLGVGGVLDAASSPVVSFRPAASWVLLHSQPLDFHLMAEASGRILQDATNDPQEPGEGTSLVSGGLRAGIRRGWLTVRTFLGAGAGGRSARSVPLRAQAAVLAEFGRDGRLGFAGFEMDADWSRPEPVTVAPNFVLHGAPVHVPFDLGIAAPWTPRSRYGNASIGLLVRVIVELDAD